MNRLKRLTVVFSDGTRLRSFIAISHRDALAMARGIAQTRETTIRRFAYINT